MLERAVGCFESAGWRFFGDSNGALRTRRPLSRRFWKHNVPGGDTLSSSLAPALSSVPKSPQGNRSAVDKSHFPFDFLYPQGARDVAALRLSRYSRRLGLRRRRRSLSGHSRTYATEATNLQKILLDDFNAPEPAEETDVHKQAAEDLARLLDQAEKDFDKAWVLYVAAGKPVKLRSALCIYLSQSLRRVDRERAWRVFEGTPSKSRSARVFVNITVSQLRSKGGRSSRLKSICEDAISKGVGEIPCAMSLAHHARRNDWVNALDIWSLASPSPTAPELTRPQPERFIFRIRRSHLPRAALGLGDFLRDQPHNASACGLAKTLLGRFSRSYHLLGSFPMDVLIRVVQSYHELGILEASHYITMIQTLQTSTTRPIFLRSIMFYRLLRQNLPEAKPPAKLINAQISGLGSFGITHGVQFFLSELTHFWGKPSIEAYKQALIVYSRTGHVLEVNHAFDGLVADHGYPRSRRLVTPLLNVHANGGDLRETYAQFQKVVEQFPLGPNTACWNILLKAHASAKDHAGALSTFAQMLQEGVPPDSYTFGTLMGIAAGRGDIESTRWLLKEAQRRQLKITMPMIDTIAQVYCQNRRPDLAEKLAKDTHHLDIEGSPLRMWNMILVYYAFRMDRDRWLGARNYMRRYGIRGDSMTMAARLLMLALKNKAHRARRVLRAFHKLRVIQSTELHYSLVLLGFIRVRNRRMIRITLNEMLRRFGQSMSVSNLTKYMSRVDHDLALLEKADPSESSEAKQRLEDAEQSLIQSLTFSNTSLPHSFSFLKRFEEDPNAPLSTPQYEYLVSHYGRRGTIKQATEMFHKYLESKKSARPSENEYDSVPFNILSLMMRAHLSADELEKVEELWRVALSNAIKLGEPLRMDQFLGSSSLSSSSSTSSPEPPLKSESDELGRRSDFDFESHRQPQILPSKRFILSDLLSTYLRSLAYREETVKIYEVIEEFQSAGFEMSGTNWCTYVQMLAASDHIGDMIKAFQVFEHKFMPHFPGWGALKRGYALKPDHASRWTHMLELPRYHLHVKSLRRQKKEPFLGRQARKDWRKLEPESMMPTYLTTVYLAAGLNRVRAAGVSEVSTDLRDIYEAAPKTVEMIGQMPYSRDKYQGPLLRGNPQLPGLDRAPFSHDLRIATGGVLGRGALAHYPRLRPFDPDETTQDEQTSDGDQSMEAQLPAESQQPKEGEQSLKVRHTMQSQLPTENQLAAEDQLLVGSQPSIESQKLHSQDQLENSERPVDIQQPIQDRPGEDIAQPRKGEQTPERQEVGCKKQPHVYQAPENAPHAYRAKDNETARLLADLFGPEDSDGKRQSLLSPEDRIDIRNDIFYLRNMRRLEFEKHVSKAKNRALRREQAAIRKGRRFSPSPEGEIESREADEAEDDVDDELEIKELQELDHEYFRNLDERPEPKKPSPEDSEDLHTGLDELAGSGSEGSELEGSDLQESEELDDVGESDESHPRHLEELEESCEPDDSTKHVEK